MKTLTEDMQLREGNTANHRYACRDRPNVLPKMHSRADVLITFSTNKPRNCTEMLRSYFALQKVDMTKTI